MPRQELVTSVVGRLIRPRYPDQVGSPHGTWPVNEPNLSGQHLATIEAAWVEVSGGVSTVKISARTPFGTVFDTYLTHVLLEQP